MARGILIANPAAGRKDKRAVVDTLLRMAHESGLSLTLELTQYAGHAGVLARQAREENLDAVAVFGGDGSIREAGESLIHSYIPLYILPAGTSNVLARSLQIPLNPLKAASIFREGNIVNLDGGTANHHTFFFMCGAGIDANIMAAAHIPAKKLLGRASFYPAVLREFFTYDFPLLHVDVDGETFSGSYIAVTNIPHFAGPYRLCPPARYDDGLLDVVIFKGRRRRDFLSYFWRIKKGDLLDRPDVVHRKGRNLRISSESQVRYQLDGDTMGEVPVEIRVIPGALKVVR
ncbi:MAG TPA: diacylglycerol kinase family lipid kinase [Thermoanaerobaculia bacterium]|nr:diacylglycerol kinase family lipid kinase [Thermoanaerobaculia bacterium]HUM29176.1 diacylglycerol kinase family lipid kinase [Thermoanaerobaculia bacterium]HXK67554.1 diacylglycerol kinase family lipid kinase [Thermoanaerobaculia bacterium]